MLEGHHGRVDRLTMRLSHGVARLQAGARERLDRAVTRMSRGRPELLVGAQRVRADAAAATLDAAGAVLAPGVIDLHTHYDAQLTWDATASPAGALGVTTVVLGNCGFGIAPAPADKRDMILANLAEVEGMALASLQAGVDWGFESVGEYLYLLNSKGVYPNVAVLASHTVMRTAVMGAEGSKRPSTDEELAQMLSLIHI